MRNECGEKNLIKNPFRNFDLTCPGLAFTNLTFPGLTSHDLAVPDQSCLNLTGPDLIQVS